MISLARALSFNGLANAFALAGINAGRHVAPLFAGDTVYAWSEVLDTADCRPRRRRRCCACARSPPRTSPAPPIPDREGDAYHPSVILDLDYWAFMPK